MLPNYDYFMFLRKLTFDYEFLNKSYLSVYILFRYINLHYLIIFHDMLTPYRIYYVLAKSTEQPKQELRDAKMFLRGELESGDTSLWV